MECFYSVQPASEEISGQSSLEGESPVTKRGLQVLGQRGVDRPHLPHLEGRIVDFLYGTWCGPRRRLSLISRDCAFCRNKHPDSATSKWEADGGRVCAHKDEEYDELCDLAQVDDDDMA